MRPRAALASVAAVLAVTLTGCGGSDDPSGDGASENSTEPAGTPEEWREAVEERVGRQLRDFQWDLYQDLTQDRCENADDEDAWGFSIAAQVDAGDPAAWIEEDVSYACPEHLQTVRAVIEATADRSREVEELCSTDPDLLTQDERDRYDAVC